MLEFFLIVFEHGMLCCEIVFGHRPVNWLTSASTVFVYAVTNLTAPDHLDCVGFALQQMTSKNPLHQFHVLNGTLIISSNLTQMV